MIKDTAKTVLCFGDSNTWGAIPASDGRFPRSIRWTGALQNLLGNEYEVISEGLCGRTLVAHSAAKPHRTGITHLHAILESHDPIDFLIIMLGTNDVKTTYNLTSEQIAAHLEETILLTKSDKLEMSTDFRTLIICPPPVIKPDGELDERMVRAPELSKKLPGLYEKVALKHRCDFLDAGKYISNGTGDGYHLDEKAHKKLAEILSQWIQK